MKFEDITPGLYIIDGDTSDPQEVKDASFRPNYLLKYEYKPGMPEVELFSMGWDCPNCVNIHADYEPAIVITVKEWERLQKK